MAADSSRVSRLQPGMMEGSNQGRGEKKEIAPLNLLLKKTKTSDLGVLLRYYFKFETFHSLGVKKLFDENIREGGGGGEKFSIPPLG